MEPNLASQFPTANALGLKASQITGLKFNPITPTPIDANSLGNTQPFKLPNQQTPTLVSGLNGYISSLSTADSLGQQLQRENQMALETTGKEKKNLIGRLGDFLSGRKGETTLTGEAYDTEGVDVAKKALRDVNVKITAIDTRANEEIKKIRENRVGANASAINDEIERVQREAASDKADLYLEKLVAQGDYDSAKEIADRKVAMQLEADSMQYEALKLAYEDNKDQYTSAEQRDYELKLSTYKNELDTQKQEKKAINELAINAAKNGAPSNLVQQALKSKNQAEAVGLIGNYVDRLEIQAKITDIAYKQALMKEKERDLTSGFLTDAEVKSIDNSPQGKKLTTLTGLKTKALAYKTLVEQFGTETYGENASLLDSAYAELQVAWKEAANLGALTGPDLQLIQDSVKPATGLRGARTNLQYGGASGIVNNVDRMIEKIDKEGVNEYSNLINRNQKYQNSDYVNGLGSPFIGEFTSQLKAGEILVKDKKTGEIGAIPEKEFNSKNYQKI